MTFPSAGIPITSHKAFTRKVIVISSVTGPAAIIGSFTIPPFIVSLIIIAETPSTFTEPMINSKPLGISISKIPSEHSLDPLAIFTENSFASEHASNATS